MTYTNPQLGTVKLADKITQAGGQRFKLVNARDIDWEGLSIDGKIINTTDDFVDHVSTIENLALDGANSIRSEQLMIYKQSSSAPTTPTGGSYDFETNTLTAPTGWKQTSTFTGEGLVWFSVSSVHSDTNTLNWSTPAVLITSETTLAKQDPVYTYSVTVYTTSVSKTTKPSTPIGGTYNLSTKKLEVNPTSITNGVTYTWTIEKSSDVGCIWESTNYYSSDDTNTGWTEPILHMNVDEILNAAEVAGQELYQQEFNAVQAQLQNTLNHSSQLLQNAQAEYNELQSLIDTIQNDKLDAVSLQQKIDELKGLLETYGWSYQPAIATFGIKTQTSGNVSEYRFTENALVSLYDKFVTEHSIPASQVGTFLSTSKIKVVPAKKNGNWVLKILSGTATGSYTFDNPSQVQYLTKTFTIGAASSVSGLTTTNLNDANILISKSATESSITYAQQLLDAVTGTHTFRSVQTAANQASAGVNALNTEVHSMPYKEGIVQIAYDKIKNEVYSAELVSGTIKYALSEMVDNKITQQVAALDIDQIQTAIQQIDPEKIRMSAIYATRMHANLTVGNTVIPFAEGEIFDPYEKNNVIFKWAQNLKIKLKVIRRLSFKVFVFTVVDWGTLNPTTLWGIPTTATVYLSRHILQSGSWQYTHTSNLRKLFTTRNQKSDSSLYPGDVDYAVVTNVFTADEYQRSSFLQLTSDEVRFGLTKGQNGTAPYLQMTAAGTVIGGNVTINGDIISQAIMSKELSIKDGSATTASISTNGEAMFGKGTTLLRVDGSGYLANNAISWSAPTGTGASNLTVRGAIEATSGHFGLSTNAARRWNIGTLATYNEVPSKINSSSQASPIPPMPVLFAFASGTNATNGSGLILCPKTIYSINQGRAMWQLNDDGSGFLAGGGIVWNAPAINSGAIVPSTNVTVTGAIRATSGYFGKGLDTERWNIGSVDVADPISNTTKNMPVLYAFYEYGQSIGDEHGIVMAPTTLYSKRGETITWKLNADGSGYLGQGNIRWDDGGSLTIGEYVDIRAAVSARNLRIKNAQNQVVSGANGSTTSKIAFWAGADEANHATAPFRVDFDGNIYGKTGRFTGMSTSGNFVIDFTKLTPYSGIPPTIDGLKHVRSGLLASQLNETSSSLSNVFDIYIAGNKYQVPSDNVKILEKYAVYSLDLERTGMNVTVIGEPPAASGTQSSDCRWVLDLPSYMAIPDSRAWIPLTNVVQNTTILQDPNMFFRGHLILPKKPGEPNEALTSRIKKYNGASINYMQYCRSFLGKELTIVLVKSHLPEATRGVMNKSTNQYGAFSDDSDNSIDPYGFNEFGTGSIFAPQEGVCILRYKCVEYSDSVKTCVYWQLEDAKKFNMWFWNTANGNSVFEVDSSELTGDYENKNVSAPIGQSSPATITFNATQY